MRGRVWLFLIGQASSVLAGSMMLLALGVWAKQLTGSNTLAGLCTAAVMASRLLGIFVGEPLGRLPRKAALLVADLATAAALGTMLLGAVLVAHLDFRILYLAAAVGLLGIGTWGVKYSAC